MLVKQHEIQRNAKKIQEKVNKIRLNQAGYRMTIEQDNRLKPFELRIKEKREVDYVT